MYGQSASPAIGMREVKERLTRALAGKRLKKVLLLPPDATRAHSHAGELVRALFDLLPGCRIDVMPALGTHEPMSEAECAAFLGIPYSHIIRHDWRGDLVKLGEVPGGFVAEVSEGLAEEPVGVEVSKRLLDPSYDLIVSIGQVVPHEVAGMANYSKNIFVGCGGAGMINSSHMLGAVYGIERILGRTDTPVRRVFDYAEEHFIAHLPLLYVLTVVERDALTGLFIGRGRELFERAAALSRERNITWLDEPLRKCVVHLNEHEFKSTWLGNKAIYRTRMAMADGGELVVLAPGVRRFGEDGETDRLIRKYGYAGRERILQAVRENADLRNNLAAAAHLIHGSADGRFTVTYAAGGLTREEVEKAGFRYMPPDEAERVTGGYVIDNPALGLWAVKGAIPPVPSS
ncbi:MAG: lactate racemase domain-containing protein [Oscillospiraceae bacterium]|jgi:nickel-dependent lactate racemase|nr:lactate racemase domain-containing protein [Oscillospiraceae bacterium]